MHGHVHGSMSDEMKTAPELDIDSANKTEAAPSIGRSSINASAGRLNTAPAAESRQAQSKLGFPLLFRASEGTAMHLLPQCGIIGFTCPAERHM